MKTKAKSTQVFEVRIWSKKHYKTKITRRDYNIFNGFITHSKSKKMRHFHSPATFMKIIEELYWEAEKG